MQSSGRRSAGVSYRYYRPDDDEEEPERQPAADDDDEAPSSEAEAADARAAAAATAAAAAAATAAAISSSSWMDRINSVIADACSSAAAAVSQQPAAAGAVAAGVVLVGLAAGLSAAKSKANWRKKLDRGKQRTAQDPAAAAAAAAEPRSQVSAAATAGSSKSGSKGSSKPKKAVAPAAPGPNSKVKPTASYVPLADGSAVVVRRPIAADNSCLFNAVGYAMHHSTNRAPFLRQVVSREVSSDPQEYSDAFLGMSNAAYCNWITQPAHWGGGIELAILAAHYRREIAAWNLASGACHVFGEERGYTKQVMVIYNGVHYDVLALAASPRADQDDDVTEFNPRTKRGKMILAAAQQLVKLNRKGKPSHQEQQQQKAAAEAAAAAAATDRQQQQAAAEATNGPTSAEEGGSAASVQQALLACSSCGEQLKGMEAAKAHAAATGHMEFAETEAAEQKPAS